ncbi:MAG: phosphatidate cytidylyltransferase [Bacteroidales bacterium]|nr:phosphatidate cytidylyltransferase [Bacteroidales bacterium]
MNSTVTRTISGVVFLVIVVASILLNKFLFGALFLFILVCMMYEFYHITMADKYMWPRIISIVAGATAFILVFLQCAYDIPFRFISIAIVPILFLTCYALFLKDKTDFGLYSHLFTGLVYIAAPLSIANFVVFKGGEYSGLLLLAFFIIIWCSDVGAYVFGMALGQKYGKKLCPEISPKKSWIGAIGGFVMALVGAIVLQLTGILTFPIYHSLILAAVMNVAGVFGDLFESQWKRFYEVKDSGNIIPGHGGMLDRFDSTLLALPAGVLYLVLFNLI